MKTSSAESSTKVRAYRTLVFAHGKTLEIIHATPNDDHAKIKIPQGAVTL